MHTDNSLTTGHFLMMRKLFQHHHPWQLLLYEQCYNLEFTYEWMPCVRGKPAGYHRCIRLSRQARTTDWTLGSMRSLWHCGDEASNSCSHTTKGKLPFYPSPCHKTPCVDFTYTHTALHVMTHLTWPELISIKWENWQLQILVLKPSMWIL